MGFLDWFKTSSKAVDMADKVVDGAIAGIDKLFFTDEEKADMSQKAFELWIELQRAIAGESSIRSITRRILAILIMGSFLLMLLAAAFIWIFNPLWSKFILEVAGNLSNLVLAIGIFYFGYYAVGGVVRSFKAKNGES